MADETEGPTILEACRAALGVTDTYFDGEISLNIAAAKVKMQLGGVRKSKAEDDSDELVRVAIIAYVKGMVGNDNPDMERYLNIFESMVTQMKMTDEYGDYGDYGDYGGDDG